MPSAGQRLARTNDPSGRVGLSTKAPLYPPPNRNVRSAECAWFKLRIWVTLGYSRSIVAPSGRSLAPIAGGFQMARGATIRRQTHEFQRIDEDG